MSRDAPRGTPRGASRGASRGRGAPRGAPPRGGGFRPPGDIARRLAQELPAGAAAQDVRRVLRSEAAGLTPKTWTQVLGLLGRRRRWDLAVAVLDHLRAEGLEVNEYHCSAAIGACEKSGQWQAALGVLSDLLRAPGAATPNVFCYGAAIGACEKGGEWRQAIRVLEAMGDGASRPAPNHFCYSAAIRACAGAQQWQLALACFEDVHRRSATPNLHTFTAALTACHRGGQWQRALALLRESRRHDLQPDVVAYSAAVSACEAGRAWRHALGLLWEMRGRGVQPNGVTYGAALCACEHRGRWAEALALIRDMAAEGVSADVVAYGAAVGACEAAGRRSEAQVITRSLTEALPQAEGPRQAFDMLVAFAKLEQRGEADTPRASGAGPEERQAARQATVALEGCLRLVADVVPDLSARELGSLLWSLAKLGAMPRLPEGLLGQFRQRVLALGPELPWQAVGLADYGLRAAAALAGEGDGCGDAAVVQEVARCLRTAGARALADVAARSARANSAPAELLLSLDEAALTKACGPVLVVDDWSVATGLEARGSAVRWWGRMSVPGRPGTPEPPWPPGSCCGGGVVRLSGVQSNCGGAALRLALAGAAALLPPGAPLWLCGLEEEGVGDAPSALQGLFAGTEEAARSGSARVLRAERLGPGGASSVPPPLQSFRGSTHLPLGEVGLADVEGWCVWPGLFAGGSLDVMTAYLLRRLPSVRIQPRAAVLDFCCGSGAIARALLQRQARAEVHLADADALALDAARRNVPEAAGRCYLGDGWRALPAGSTFDWVVSNPPVHRWRQDDFGVVEALVEGAAARLRLGGRLWIVAQVHCPVGPLLEGRGLRVKAESDGRFTLWRARLLGGRLAPPCAEKGLSGLVARDNIIQAWVPAVFLRELV